MKTGDVVKNIDPVMDGTFIDDSRLIGCVLRLDSYEGGAAPSEAIVEILWSSGKKDWILRRRMEIVSEV